MIGTRYQHMGPGAANLETSYIASCDDRVGLEVPADLKVVWRFGRILTAGDFLRSLSQIEQKEQKELLEAKRPSLYVIILQCR